MRIQYFNSGFKTYENIQININQILCCSSYR